MLINTEAFVLKSQKYRESDSLLTLYSRQYGKLSAVAKGSRKPKSKMLAGVQPFSHGEYVLYKGRNMYTVNQAEVKHGFYALREDYERLAYASYIVELVLSEAIEGQGNTTIFSLLGNTLTLLCREGTIQTSLIRAFEIKFMANAGYQPNLMGCTSCGTEELKDPLFFSHSQGGVVCHACQDKSKDRIRVSKNLMTLAQSFLMSDLRAAAKIKVSPSLDKQLHQLMGGYIQCHFGYFASKSLRLIET